LIVDSVFVAVADKLLICADESAFFHGESIADSPINYLWNFGDATTSTLSATSHLYTEPGVYDVSVEMWTSSGCIASETVVFEDIVTVVSPPEAGFVISDNLMNLPGAEIQINSVAGDNVTCYYVMSDGGISEDCDFSYTFSNSGEMTITQTVTDEFGCQNSITGAVIISGYVFFAPNAFTPDDDGLNYVWKPEATGISEYYLRIYNRWGDMIFSTTDMDKPWVGDVHNGEYYAQNDIYNYIVTAKDLMGLPKEFKGHVVLMR